MNHRIYLDTTHEILSNFRKVSLPPRFVIHTPIIFNTWLDWANVEEFRQDKKKTADIEPLGQEIKPDWLEYKFDNLETFYQYFQDLTKGI